MSMRRGWLAALAFLVACGGDGSDGSPGADRGASISGAGPEGLIALWEAETPAFGIFVPSERPFGATDEDGNRLPPLYTVEGARALADNPLLDYLFLNLEGAYDPESVRTLVTGLDEGTTAHRPTLLVRIPTIEDAGEEATRARVAEVLDLGADGVVIPHVRSAEEARLAASFFEEAGADVWSPDNPGGSVIAMLMVEDRGAVAEAEDIAALPGYSVLACGIGSLTRDMGGDREGAEAANLDVLRHATEHGLPDMITANADDIVERIEQGFLGLLLSGPAERYEEAIRIGRAAAGRPAS